MGERKLDQIKLQSVQDVYMLSCAKAIVAVWTGRKLGDEPLHSICDPKAIVAVWTGRKLGDEPLHSICDQQDQVQATETAC